MCRGEFNHLTSLPCQPAGCCGCQGSLQDSWSGVTVTFTYSLAVAWLRVAGRRKATIAAIKKFLVFHTNTNLHLAFVYSGKGSALHLFPGQMTLQQSQAFTSTRFSPSWNRKRLKKNSKKGQRTDWQWERWQLPILSTSTCIYKNVHIRTHFGVKTVSQSQLQPTCCLNMTRQGPIIAGNYCCCCILVVIQNWS